MSLVKCGLFLAAQFIALSAAAQLVNAPAAAHAGLGVVPGGVVLSVLEPRSASAGAGSLSLLSPAFSPSISAPLHSESALAAPSALRAAVAVPLASLPVSEPVQRVLGDSGSAAPLDANGRTGISGRVVGRASVEGESPAARIASTEDRILRSVFGDRRDAESVVAAAPVALERSSLSAASTPIEVVPAPAPKAPVPAGKDSPLLRAVTGIGLVAVQAALIHWGMLPFAIFTAAVSALMLFEYATMMNGSGRPVQRVTAVIAGASLAFTVAHGLASIALPIVAGVILLKELFGKQHSFDRAALTLAGTVLLGWLPGHLALIRESNPHGQALTFMFFTAVWATDTFAYIVGKTLGRRKIAPVLSPKKTWEGSIGGFLAALATVLLFKHFMPDLFSWRTAAIVGAAIGVVGQLSGFAASMIKRSAGVKDSGKLLPGHGGFLDRFDSFLLSAPLVYWLLAIFR